MEKNIIIKGARVNNLKNIDIEIPRNKLVVFTGVSGSGKSSLAFDTIYAEGQMRYVESFSSYARQFLGQMSKPDVDVIEGLSPAISIEQKTTSKNPRSTVGTVTETYDYLRLLWARIGIPHCPVCGREIRRQFVDQIVDRILALPVGTRFQILAPVIRGKKGEHKKVFENAKKSGYVRMRVVSVLYELSEEIKLDKNKNHNIEIVVDRLVVKQEIILRLGGSIETALSLSDGLVIIHQPDNSWEELFSQSYACGECGISIPELSPRMFSFNSPYGACTECSGLGSHLSVDAEMIIPDRTLSIINGGISASGWEDLKSGFTSKIYLDALSKKYNFSLETPIENLPPEVMEVILYGTKGEKQELHYENEHKQKVNYKPFEGVVKNLERRYHETEFESVRQGIEEYMFDNACSHCHGDRLSPTV